MKRTPVSMVGALVALVVLAPVLSACGSDGGASDRLMPGAPYSTDSLAAGPNTFNHEAQPNTGENGVTDPIVKMQEDQSIGSPDVVARLHGAQKIPYFTLGVLLADLGVDMTSQAPGSAAQLYRDGFQALGAPVYPNRVPEMTIPSTSALAKQYDIFVAAAPEILAHFSTSKRCAGVTLVAGGQLTQDGISCLIGKPARAEHVTLANDLVAQASDATTGQQIAIATLLEAAHTSE